jgi:aspartyl-tRNA synthetase
MLRTHNAQSLNLNNKGQKVTVAGWVDRRRDHGGLIFIDLRDRSGLLQIVFNPETNKEAHELAGTLRSEFCIQVTGVISPRPEGTINEKLPTGEIELLAESLKILNTSETPPFYINEEVDVDENLRLKYRYLDMRRPTLKNNLIFRHKVVHLMRTFLDSEDFLEVETPILTKSTPEGARDYLVPSRLHEGTFYALPQSPQQMKQLLMCGGLERYYQVAKCFRDEDTRADRQPEFTQLDIEMSFVEPEDVMGMIERMLLKIMDTLRPDAKYPRHFPRIQYSEAMSKYGSDKPDLRFKMYITDISDIVKDSEFGVFKNTVANGGTVKGVVLPGCAGYSRAEQQELVELTKTYGSKGMVPLAYTSEMASIEELTPETVKSVATKYLSVDQLKEIAVRMGANPGDLVCLIADREDKALEYCGRFRQDMGLKLGLADPNEFAFAFVVDFPLFKWDEEGNRWDAVHHLFTAPFEEDIPLITMENAGKARSQTYDIVLNGFEIGGGGIRIHNAELQEKVLEVMGYPKDIAEDRFGHLIEAFKYGAPPHGGIAMGIDRVVMLLCGADSIREVIAFPKNQSAQDLLFNAPSTVEKQQIKDLHIKLIDD